MTAAAEDDCLTGLWFAGQKYYPVSSFPDTDGWQTKPEYPVFKTLRSWLADYFAGKKIDASYKSLFKLMPAGTEFQKKVWKNLLNIPYGKLATYGAIAKKIGSHARAVGGAVGRNPISLLIPCHRVVGSGGNLTGYAGGLERKKALLIIEGSISNS
jgi:methylated-DNA-[protein]-cysteine S-methyltransferase